MANIWVYEEGRECQALTIGLVCNERGGLATSLNIIAMQLPQLAGPTLSGGYSVQVILVYSFMPAGVCQAIYLVLYSRFFRKQNKPGAKE
ncbi:MAG: hypothetical protein EKK39_13865 [Sphingobacteriales bacterium]|uniref:hypothetical protein n=1 Tax=Hydrotalea flava TaxID=714549 RepID=UPI000FC20666|nr:hypothetical protein [Hydrotalea flava]RTL47634.1 MAG: hypothetical protein EKK39_13865 [Sphingobacteriales bacterium]